MNLSRRRRMRSGKSVIGLPAEQAGLEPEFTELASRWALRALVELGGFTSVIQDTHCSDPLLLQFVGLEIDEDADHDAAALVTRLRALHRQRARKPVTLPAGAPITGNLTWLAAQVGLTEVDQRILLFRVLDALFPQLREANDAVGQMTASKVHAFLSLMLEIPLADVRAAFEPDSAFGRTRLLTIDDSCPFDFHHKVELLEGFADCITKAHANPFDMFAAHFAAAPPAELTLEQFAHLGDRLQHLRVYLAQALAGRKAGVNVLVYGPPGTGKTAMARALAQAIGADLFEIGVQDKHGEHFGGNERLSAYRLSQRVLATRSDTVLLFDEIEDIQAGDADVPSIGAQRNGRIKGWFNRMLETNPVPSIWITNDVDFLDPAHLRRFDYHLCMDIPPARVRRTMLARHVEPLGVDEAWCDDVAVNDTLAPAAIARAARVVGTMREGGVDAPAQALLDEVLEAAMNVQDARYRRGSTGTRDLSYRLESVNADFDLGQLLAGLRASGEGRVCLYGPPGTGKSAFAAHVARELGRPPLLRRASDLLSAYVGGTEQRMAQAFAEARREGAVLILDEADSFLRSREQARHGWEVTAVNEMLTQMESFDGIFFATTNLMAQLDAASLRRFDAKVRFDYLRSDQCRALLADTARVLGIDPASAANALPIDRLVPGDFANLVRQSRLRPVRSVEEMLVRLGEEARHRNLDAGRGIGFLAAA